MDAKNLRFSEDALLVAMASNEIPRQMQEGIIRYLCHGIRPGSFLCAVFANNLALASIHADPSNAIVMDVYGKFLINNMPEFIKGEMVWGSERAIDRWVKINQERRNDNK